MVYGTSQIIFAMKPTKKTSTTESKVIAILKFDFFCPGVVMDEFSEDVSSEDAVGSSVEFGWRLKGMKRCR